MEEKGSLKNMEQTKIKIKTISADSKDQTISQMT